MEQNKFLTIKQASEIYSYLQSKLELPDNIKKITLSIGVDELPTVTCTFIPKAKE